MQKLYLESKLTNRHRQLPIKGMHLNRIEIHKLFTGGKWFTSITLITN